MKRLISVLALLALLAGCATQGPHDTTSTGPVQDPNSVYSDPTYPGPGVHFGIGIGSWGGHRGGGVGFGMGF
jgi:hypothetical protein